MPNLAGSSSDDWRKRHARRFREWKRIDVEIKKLQAKQQKELEALRDVNYPLWLQRGRMRPTEVVITSTVHTGDRIKIRRLDTGKEYWVSVPDLRLFGG